MSARENFNQSDAYFLRRQYEFISTSQKWAIQAENHDTKLIRYELTRNRTARLSNLEKNGFKKFRGLPKTDEAIGSSPILAEEFFESVFFQIGQHVVLLRIIIIGIRFLCTSVFQYCIGYTARTLGTTSF